LGKIGGRSGRILTSNELNLITIWVPNYGVKFHQNLVRIATVGEWTDRQTDRHTDASDFIIHPTLCYSNGTDKMHHQRKITRADMS